MSGVIELKLINYFQRFEIHSCVSNQVFEVWLININVTNTLVVPVMVDQVPRYFGTVGAYSIMH